MLQNNLFGYARKDKGMKDMKNINETKDMKDMNGKKDMMDTKDRNGEKYER